MIQKITNAGIEALSSALTTGGKIEFTRCAIGSGTFNPAVMDPAAMTGLINQTASKEISIVRAEENGVAVIADMDNTIIPGGSKIAEMGLYATAGGSEMLFAYAYTLEPETVPEKGQETYERRFISHIAMSDEELALTVTYNTFDDAIAQYVEVNLAPVATSGKFSDLKEVPDLQAKHVTVTAELPASSWSELSQTVSVTGVTAGNTVVVSPAPASTEAWGKAGVYASAQADGTLTFACKKAPAGALTANIAIFN